MRQLLILLAISSISLFAQDAPGRGAAGGRGGAPHKNLKVLSEAEFADGAMRKAVAGLGIMCNDCHNATDRSSDEKPIKLQARMMFAMVKDINSKFPDGKEHVTCYTCHRGTQTPLTAPPAQ